MSDFELKLPAEISDGIPTGHDDMVRYLSNYFNEVIDKYDLRFQRRVSGVFGGPLSKYERSILRDFLVDAIISKR